MIILDSNVVSGLMKSQPDPKVVEWVDAQPESELFTTSITEGEIFPGIELLSRGRRRDALLATAERLFDADFEGRILGFHLAATSRLALTNTSSGSGPPFQKSSRTRPSCP